MAPKEKTKGGIKRDQHARRVQVDRKITYTTDLDLAYLQNNPKPDDLTLEDHPLFQFFPGSSEDDEFQRLKNMHLFAHKMINTYVLAEMNERDGILAMLGEKWLTALNGANNRVWQELTLEFHATLRVTGRFDDPKGISFSLGRQVHQMDVHRVGHLLRFYTDEEMRTAAYKRLPLGTYHSRVNKNGVKECKCMFVYSWNHRDSDLHLGFLAIG